VIEDFRQWGGFYIPHIPVEQFHGEAMKGAEETLDRVCKEQLKGCPNFQKRLLFGDSIEGILKTIESEKIAHELRNSLTVVGGLARRLHEKSSENDPHREYLGIIFEEVKTLEEKVSNLIRLGAGG
jgi:hypothetical protein